MLYSPKIIVAMDSEDPRLFWSLVDQFNPRECRLKIGKTLFTQQGPELIQAIKQRGFDVFLDLKFHDIPQQVAGACRAAAQWGVWMINVHTLGGSAMMHAAREAIDAFAVEKRPLLIGVTLLTSLSAADVQMLGIQGTPTEAVLRLATLGQEAGLDGVVCSAQETPLIKSILGKEFLCVTPGIRLADELHHDQKRVVTPAQAILGGSDYLVIGRPVTDATHPSEKLRLIHNNLCGLV